MAINLNVAFDYILSGMVSIYNFLTNVLVFQIGNYTFNALQFALGAIVIRLVIHALFGADDAGETEVSLYDN